VRPEVLNESYLPSRLVGREDRLQALRATPPQGLVAVFGPAGTGKTTLARLAFEGAVWVDCGVHGSYPNVVKTLRRSGLREKAGVSVVFDDFTLAHRTPELWDLVLRLSERNRVVLVVHPSIRGELRGAPLLIEMPPYSAEELYLILEDRALQGELPVADKVLRFIAEKVGYPRGSGSARLALRALRLAFQAAQPGPVSLRHAELAFALLRL